MRVTSQKYWKPSEIIYHIRYQRNYYYPLRWDLRFRDHILLTLVINWLSFQKFDLTFKERQLISVHVYLINPWKSFIYDTKCNQRKPLLTWLVIVSTNIVFSLTLTLSKPSIGNRTSSWSSFWTHLYFSNSTTPALRQAVVQRTSV